MASKQKTHLKAQKDIRSSKIAYFDVLTVQDVSSTIDVLTGSTDLLPEIVAELNPYLTKFLLRVIRDVTHLKSTHSLREYYAACKRRYDDLSRICSVLLLADEGDFNVSRLDSHGGKRQYIFNSPNRKVVITCNETDYYVGTKHPRSYSPLFRALTEIVFALVSLRDQGVMSVADFADQLYQLSIVITTIGKVYEDIRGGDQFKDEEYRETIVRVNKKHDLDHDSEYFSLFQELRKDIEEGLSDPSKCKRYVKDIVKAIPREMTAFQPEDYYVSMKSTGTLYKGKRIPGLYASILETDPVISGDELIGYKSAYNSHKDESCTQFDRKSILIKQHKLPYRLIHMAINPIQDRAFYYHNRLMEVLNQIGPDCTMNQNKGVTFALKITAPKFRLAKKSNIYCLDISKATDTLNKEFQRECIAILFGDEHAQNWHQLVTGEHKLVDGKKILSTFTPQCGQPQGYGSSFPAFAWVHHVVMRLIMLKHNMQDSNPLDFYRVLGDDSIMSVVDTDGEILRSYISCCQFINWDTNESKGYIYRYGTNDAPFAEFAKIRVLDGKIMTPIPIRLLLNAIHSPGGYLGYQWWLTKFFKRRSIYDVFDYLTQNYPGNIDERHLLVMGGLGSLGIEVYQDFGDLPESNQLDEKLKTLLLAAYFRGRLKSTIMNQFLPDYLIGEPDCDARKDPFLNDKFEKELLNLIENLDHKYLKVIENNEQLINAVHEVFGDEIPSHGVTPLKLSASERDQIYSACESLLLIQEWETIPDYDSFLTNIRKALDILTRFNPRSRVKDARNQSELLGTTVQTMEQFFNVFPELLGDMEEAI